MLCDMYFITVGVKKKTKKNRCLARLRPQGCQEAKAGPHEGSSQSRVDMRSRQLVTTEGSALWQKGRTGDVGAQQGSNSLGGSQKRGLSWILRPAVRRRKGIPSRGTSMDISVVV